jgi:MFS transporter, DHA2 family, methylenomycin A resistance protein
VASVGYFIITLDALVVTVALPAIAADVGGGIAGLQWVIDAYTVMFAALLLFAGSASDRFGARETFGAGVAIFTLSSAICAVAPSLGLLVAARLAQGVGAALMTPASMALLLAAYPESAERARAIGIWAVGAAVATVSGPLLGGALSLVSWRLIFLINVPVGLLTLLYLGRVPSSPKRPVPFDFIGQAASLLGLTALIWAVIEGGETGYGKVPVVTAFVLASMAFTSFFLAQRHGSHPMVPPALARSPRVVMATAAGFVVIGSFFGMVFLLSLYLQQDRGLTALETGFVFLPMTLLTVWGNVAAGRAAARLGVRVPITVGLVMMFVGLCVLSLALDKAPTVLLAVLVLPIGLGGATASPAVAAMLLDSVPGERIGTASGLLNTSRQLGGALAVAAFGALIAHRGLAAGARIGLLSAAGLVGASLVLSRATLRRPWPTAPDEGPPLIAGPDAGRRPGARTPARVAASVNTIFARFNRGA